MRAIPVLRDAAAAGTARVVDEREIEYTLILPRQMLRSASNIVGVKIYGDSMSPVLEANYIALIDCSRRNAIDLINKIVAARDGDGITVKWLRREDGFYLLVPENTDLRHPIKVLKAEADCSIVGEVVKWIGTPRTQ